MTKSYYYRKNRTPFLQLYEGWGFSLRKGYSNVAKVVSLPGSNYLMTYSQINLEGL